jgi:hypothetical protein
MAKKGSGKKKGGGSDRDKGFEELLKLVQKDPSLMNELMLDPDSLAKKVKTKGARDLIKAIDPRTYLESVLYGRHCAKWKCTSVSNHS